MKITDWPVGERPREKLVQKGAESLSDAELLGIFINVGVADKNAVDVAREILRQTQGIQGLLTLERRRFLQLPGLGDVKFSQLHALRELIVRGLAARLKQGPIFDNVEQAKDFVTLQMQGHTQEVFAVLLLTSQHQLISFRKLFFGTVNAAAVYPREIVKHALRENAAAIILVHNHPSGIAEPSQADISITQHIKQAMALIDVKVLDHFVVGDTNTVSFAKRGLM